MCVCVCVTFYSIHRDDQSVYKHYSICLKEGNFQVENFVSEFLTHFLLVLTLSKFEWL